MYDSGEFCLALLYISGNLQEFIDIWLSDLI